MINSNAQETGIYQVNKEEAKTIRHNIVQNENTSFKPSSFHSALEIRKGEEAEQKDSDPSIRPFHETIKGSGILSHNIKQISRYLAKKIPPEQKIQIIEEYNSLVEKKYNEGLTLDGERRLKYMKWQLDIIYDAEVGDKLDNIERFTQGMEIFADELGRLIKKFDPSKGHREPFKK